jgi:uncharacterized protein (DUF1810 family)
MSLDRFTTAQADAHAGFETALTELRAGRKTSHWIWYVFPQLAGLGRSPTAQAYAIKNLEEACDYLRDPLLGPRLRAATLVVHEQLRQRVRLDELMGSEIDSVKLVSSLTLFLIAARRLGALGEDFAAECGAVLVEAERQGYARCAFTLAHAK